MSPSNLALTMPYDDPTEEDSVHSPFHPEDIRPGEKFRIELKNSQGLQISESMPVWRLSPLGVEFIADQKVGKSLSTGSKIDIRMIHPTGSTSHEGLVVAAISQMGEKTLVGVRWLPPEQAGPRSEERRTAKRWMCGSEYLPTGISANPLRFNDYIHFRIYDISKDGMQIEASMRNRALIPGMKLSAIVTFPLIGKITVDYEIIRAKVTRSFGKDTLSLGCKFIDPDLRLNELIGQYLLQFGPPLSLTELRQEGLKVKSINQAITYSCVKTEQEYFEVLELRKLAWASIGKVDLKEKTEYFADEYDARARILTASCKGKIVASLRVIFPEEGDQLEHEKYLKMPKDFPRNDQMVEITRVVVHPEFRGNDLLYSLFKQAVVVCLQAERRWILGNSDPKLLPLYRKIGFKILPLSFDLEVFNIHPYLFLGDIYATMAGHRVNPIVWNLMYSDLTKYLTRSDLIDFKLIPHIKLIFYRLFKPLSYLVAKLMVGKTKR